MMTPLTLVVTTNLGKEINMVWISRTISTDLGVYRLEEQVIPKEKLQDEIARYVQQGFALDVYASDDTRLFYDKYDPETGWFMSVCFELQEVTV